MSGHGSHGSYPPNQPSDDYYYSSSSRQPRPPSHSAPGGASTRPRTSNPNEGYYPPNQTSSSYYTSSSRHPRPPSHSAPGGASGGPRAPNLNEGYYPPNQTSSSYYTSSSSHHPRASPAPGGTSGRSFPHEGQSSGRHPATSSHDDVVHTWTQQGQITASEDLSSYIVTVMLQDGRHAYQCGRPECKREGTFTSRSTVVAHIRTVHLQERPFICTGCGTTFGRKQDAERHVQSKNRGKVYQCQYCLETFSRKDYLSGVHEICCSARPPHA